MSDFMKGMQQQTIRANGVRINAWVGGKGAPVVLLHGYPQTGQMWRKVVPGLLDKFTVVCPDLRGYGDSDKPRDGYDKRSMAKDIGEVMSALGFKSYSVVGHDRGARVAHRLVMDYRDQVRNLTVLDIVPTHTVFRDTGKELAAAYWHWFFFQVPDLPEIMMANSAEPFLRHMFRALCFRQDAIEELMFALKGRYTLVVVTHNMAQARRASDECIFMLMGELVEHRRTEDLFLAPKNSRTAEYIEGRYG